MSRRLFTYGISVAFCALFLFGPPALQASEKAVLSHSDMMHQSIRQRVQALRQQRYQRQPYLEKSFVRTLITQEKVHERTLFVSHDAKNLRELVERASQVHTKALASRERISLANQRMIVALRNLFPELEFEWEERDGDLSASPFNSMKWQLNTRIPLFRGGILWNTLLQEKAGRQAARKDYEAVVGDLVNDISAAYFEYNRTLQVLDGMGRAIDDMNRYADISNQKFNAGIISEIEHLNVRSLFSQMQYDYQTSKQEAEIAKLELQKFLDLDISQDIAIMPLYDLEELLLKPIEEGGDHIPWNYEGEAAEHVDEEADGPALSDLVDLAYQNRPELQVEAFRLDSARLEERIRWGEMIPHADLVIETGQLAEAFDFQNTNPPFNKDVRIQLEINWNILGNTFEYELEGNQQAPNSTQFASGAGSQFTRNTISVGVFDNLRAIADAKEAEADKLDQIVELEEKEKEVILDVKQAYYDFQKAKIQVRSSLQRVNYRKRLINVSQFRLEKNEIEVSEFMQAKIDLLQEVGTLHKALGDYFTAKAALNRAVGVRDFFPIEDKYDE